MTTSSTKENDADLSYLGHQSERLSDLIEDQTKVLFAREGIRVPVKSCSLVDALERCEPASASDLAIEMGRSHQIISQKLPKLIKLNLVERKADPDDARRSVHKLTSDGRMQMERIREISPQIAAAYREIEADIGPVYSQITATIQSLETATLVDRIQ